MATVKIELDKDETVEQAEDVLFKAVLAQSTGEGHDEENFSDPAMADLINRLEEQHKLMFSEMVAEINEELDKEYSDGNF